MKSHADILSDKLNQMGIYVKAIELLLKDKKIFFTHSFALGDGIFFKWDGLLKRIVLKTDTLEKPFQEHKLAMRIQYYDALPQFLDSILKKIEEMSKKIELDNTNDKIQEKLKQLKGI